MPSEIEPFLPGTVTFSQYLEQLDWIFIHHKVTDKEEQKITFLASCNTEVFTELKLLFPDRSLKAVSFSEICRALCKRYDKSESILRRRYKFYRREQGLSEKAEDFIRAVKQLADRCDFGEFKSQAIRDRLVFGIGDRDLQKRLIDKGDLTLSEAEQYIRNEDMLVLGSCHASGESSRTEANNEYRPTRSMDQLSDIASKKRHDRSRSRSFERRVESSSERKVRHCTYCNRVGHIRRFCFDLKRKKNRYSELNCILDDSSLDSV